MPRVGAALADIAASVDASGPTRLVVIDGRSGAGKTTLARELTDALPSFTVLSLDQIYPGWDGLRRGADAAISGVLVPLAQGRAGRWQGWNWETDEPSAWHEVAPGTPLIIEGAGILTPAAAALAPVRVWVEADDAVRRERALRRDGATYEPHWERWATQEQDHLRQNGPRSLATHIVRA
ncbi:AAA family ATPase [Microbacterium neimengense]